MAAPFQRAVVQASAAALLASACCTGLAAGGPDGSASSASGPLRATLGTNRAAQRPVAVTLTPGREATLKLGENTPVAEIEFSRPVRAVRTRLFTTLVYPVDRRRTSAMTGVERASGTGWIGMGCRQRTCRVPAGAAAGLFGADGSVSLRPVLAGVRNRLREPELSEERRQRLEDGLRQCERAKREFCRAFVTHQEIEVRADGSAEPLRLLVRMPIE